MTDQQVVADSLPAEITWFATSPDAGDPECICSLCGEPIGEEEAPVRIFNTGDDIEAREARFHIACFSKITFTPDLSRFEMPDFYLPPLGLPLRWQDEVTGMLATAIDAFLTYQVGEGPEPAEAQVGLIQKYFRYHINAPCWKSSGLETELAALRAGVGELRSPGDLNSWIHKCLEIGIDPLRRRAVFCHFREG